MADSALVQKLYISYFGRPADVAGATNASNLIDWTGSPASLLADFGKSAEYTNQFSGLTSNQIVNKIYNNLFGRDAEAAGLNFWSAKIAAGQITLANAVWTILSGVTTGSGDDTAVNSKVTWAQAFTTSLSTNAAASVAYNAATIDSVKAQLLTIKDAATLATANTGLSAFVTTMTTNGSGVAGSTFTLTTTLDNLTGTAGNDAFNATLIDNGVPGYSATNSTLQLGDSVDGGLGVNSLNITSNVGAAYTASGFTAKNIQTVNVNNTFYTAGTALTFDASTAPQLTAVNATGQGDLTVTGIGNAAIGVSGVTISGTAGTAHTVKAVGAKTVNLTGTTIAATATDTLALDISGAASTGVAAAVTVNSNGAAANTITSLKIGNLVDGASSLTVNAAAGLKTTVVEGVANTLKTVTISGATTGTVDLGTLSSTALTSVDASGLTAGGAKVGIGDNVATTFKGGAGNDTVTIKASAVMTGTVDGGAGTDTLALSTAASLPNATTGKLFTNFEVLQVSNAGLVGTTETYDPTLLTGITSYKVAASTGAVALTNLGAAPVITVTGAVAGTAGLAATLKDATGTSDVLTINLDNGSTATSGNVNGASVSKLTSVGTETFNINSNGVVLGTGTANSVTLDPANTSLSKIVVSGSQLFSLTTGAVAKNLTVDGSSATGNLTLDASGAAAGAVQVNLNGGSGNDTIKATAQGASNGTIYGGKGGDAVTLAGATDTIVFKAASDSVWDTTGVAGVAGKGTMDTYAAFTSGTDKIDLTAFNVSTNALKQVVVKTFANVAAINTATAAATFFQDGASVARGAVLATDGTDGYLFVDANKDGVFNAATDLAIKLTAVTTLAQTDLVWG